MKTEYVKAEFGKVTVTFETREEFEAIVQALDEATNNIDSAELLSFWARLDGIKRKISLTNE